MTITITEIEKIAEIKITIEKVEVEINIGRAPEMIEEIQGRKGKCSNIHDSNIFPVIGKITTAETEETDTGETTVEADHRAEITGTRIP